MATANIDATIDSVMEGIDDADANDGAGLNVAMGVQYMGEEKTYWHRPIGNFDVSSIATSVINSAKMRCYAWNIWALSCNATIYRCTRPSTWTEMGVTANDYDGVNPWTAPMGDYEVANGEAVTPVGFVGPAGAGWHEIEGLLEFVTDAIANRSNIVSVIMRLDDEDPAVNDGFRWYSSEYVTDAGLRWEIEIDHTPPAPAGGPRRLRGLVAG